jgi:hypothetical protein
MRVPCEKLRRPLLAGQNVNIGPLVGQTQMSQQQADLVAVAG